MKKRSLKKHPSSNLPSAKKIAAGCYIDFEGFAANEHRSSPPPVLIGTLNFGGDGEFKQVVFTEAYRWAAEDPGVKHEVAFDPDRDSFFQELADSSGMMKPLFAFSEHELRVIHKHLDINITRRYRNVRSIAKRWLNRHPEHQQPKAYCLSDMAEVLGIKLMKKSPEGGVTERLRNVREHSSSEEKWSSAPPTIKRQWREVLQHNRSDVLAIYEILMHIRQHS